MYPFSDISSTFSSTSLTSSLFQTPSLPSVTAFNQSSPPAAPNAGYNTPRVKQYAYWPVVTKGSISPSSLISSIESIQESKSSGASQSLSSNNALSYHVPHVSKMSGKP